MTPIQLTIPGISNSDNMGEAIGNLEPFWYLKAQPFLILANIKLRYNLILFRLNTFCSRHLVDHVLIQCRNPASYKVNTVLVLFAI